MAGAKNLDEDQKAVAILYQKTLEVSGWSMHCRCCLKTLQVIRHLRLTDSGVRCADADSNREVQALFDDIEYAKGGAVLRMLWNYMSSHHYTSSRLPANVPLGHDTYVRLSHSSVACSVSHHGFTSNHSTLLGSTSKQ